MSNLLKEKRTLTSLRARLEGKRERECWSCKGFEHLAQNYRKQKEEGKGTVVPQNKFEVLRSRIMQYGVEERMIRRIGVIKVECFKYREKGQMQEVSIVDKKEESSVCDKATKSTAKGEAGMPYKGRSTRKKVKEDKRGGGGAHGQAMRSTARMKEEFGERIKEKSRGTLWQRSARGNTPTGVRVVYRGSNSDVYAVRKM